MSWDKSINGDTDKLTYFLVVGDVIKQLDKTINNIEDRWCDSNDYCLNCYYPPTIKYDTEKEPHKGNVVVNPGLTIYNLIHDILSYEDNIDEDTDEKIDEDREWDCLYEYFLGYDQYDNFSGYGEDWSVKKININNPTGKNLIWWVSEDDENYSKMNKFLEDLYHDCIVHVKNRFKQYKKQTGKDWGKG